MLWSAGPVSMIASVVLEAAMMNRGAWRRSVMVSSPLDGDEVGKQKHHFSQQTFLVGGRKMGWGGEGM
jgi:hypothetical protein